MSAARSLYGVALGDLVDRLAAIAAADDLDNHDRSRVFTYEVLATPGIENLDDHLLEALLGFAGFDLTDADDLDLATSAICFLLGTELLEIGCSHQEPSPLCWRGRQVDDHDAFIAGCDFPGPARRRLRLEQSSRRRQYSDTLTESSSR